MPRNAAAMGTCDLRTTVLGTPVELPFLLAPIGSSRMFFPRGECVAAAQAGAAGTGYILSTLSGCRLEEVKAASSGPVWYQLYLIGGREAATAAIRRARAAGFSALVVTIDTAVAGQRERDLRNGGRELLSGDPLKMLPHVGQLLARPAWLVGYLRDGGMMKFPNVVIPGEGPMAYEDVGAALERSTVTWQDIVGFAKRGRDRSSLRACSARRMRVARSMRAPTPSSSPITVAGSSTASRRHCSRCPK